VVANSGRFLVASLDGPRASALTQRRVVPLDPFDHPLARAYGVPVIASCR
jgi:hypothetical protein